MATANKTIVLRGNRNAYHEEALAVGIFSPGHLLKTDSAGKFLKQTTAGDFSEKLFAKEDAYQGKTIADAYAVGDLAFAHIAQPGDIVNALLKPGVSYAVGDELINAGDGTLMKRSAAASAAVVKQVIGKLTEAVNLSATGAVAAHGAVRIY